MIEYEDDEMKVILHFSEVPTITKEEITDGVVRILLGTFEMGRETQRDQL